MPQDVHALVATVVGAALGWDAKPAGAQHFVLGAKALDLFLEHPDLPGHRAATADRASPVVVCERDGAGDPDQGLVYQENLGAIA